MTAHGSLMEIGLECRLQALDQIEEVKETFLHAAPKLENIWALDAVSSYLVNLHLERPGYATIEEIEEYTQTKRDELYGYISKAQILPSKLLSAHKDSMYTLADNICDLWKAYNVRHSLLTEKLDRQWEGKGQVKHFVQEKLDNTNPFSSLEQYDEHLNLTFSKLDHLFDTLTDLSHMAIELRRTKYVAHRGIILGMLGGAVFFYTKSKASVSLKGLPKDIRNLEKNFLPLLKEEEEMLLSLRTSPTCQ